MPCYSEYKMDRILYYFVDTISSLKIWLCSFYLTYVFEKIFTFSKNYDEKYPNKWKSTLQEEVIRQTLKNIYHSALVLP